MGKFLYNIDRVKLHKMVSFAADAGIPVENIKVLMACVGNSINNDKIHEIVGIVDVTNGNHDIPELMCNECGYIPYGVMKGNQEEGNWCVCSNCGEKLFSCFIHNASYLDEVINSLYYEKFIL